MKHGALRIYKSNELPDYKKSGYYNNMLTGSIIAPDSSLLPFFYAYATTGSSITISSFTLQSINKDGEVCVSSTLTSTWVETEDNDTHKIMKYRGNQDILGSLTTYVNGLYRYKIVLNTGKIYYSELFLINDYKLISTIGVGDFDLTDLDTTDFS